MGCMQRLKYSPRKVANSAAVSVTSGLESWWATGGVGITWPAKAVSGKRWNRWECIPLLMACTVGSAHVASEGVTDEEVEAEAEAAEAELFFLLQPLPGVAHLPFAAFAMASFAAISFSARAFVGFLALARDFGGIEKSRDKWMPMTHRHP